MRYFQRYDTDRVHGIPDEDFYTLCNSTYFNTERGDKLVENPDPKKVCKNCLKFLPIEALMKLKGEVYPGWTLDQPVDDGIYLVYGWWNKDLLRQPPFLMVAFRIGNRVHAAQIEAEGGLGQSQLIAKEIIGAWKKVNLDLRLPCPSDKLRRLVEDQEWKKVGDEAAQKAAMCARRGELTAAGLCVTCGEKPGTKRVDGGLPCGSHCDECWEEILTKCRQRSW